MDIKPKILILNDWFAPAYKGGGTIRSCVNFAYAMRTEFEIFVLTSNHDLGIDEPLQNIESDQWISFDQGIKVCYLSPKKQKSGDILKRINEVKPDFLYLNSMFSLNFSLKPLYLSFTKQLDVKVILGTRGMLHKGAIQHKTLKKKTFFLLLRIFGLLKNIYFHASDVQEQKDIIQHLKVKKEKIQIVEDFPQTAQQALRFIFKKKGHLKLVFISRLERKKNLLFFLQCLQLLKSNAAIKLSVIGASEEGYWNKCLTIVKKLPTNIQVDYKGSIEHEEVEKNLLENHFFILPTFGENFGHAIFESFLAGRPVIISDQTPWRNLSEKKIGRDIPLDKPQKFIQAIEHAAAMEQKEFDVSCQNAWHFAKEFITNSDLKKRYIQLFSR